ncbi:MAG: hypothetical protein NT018_13945 [Armatimonadetes bacterium]|nr:hypothetical protein [Armatimonadota bacterium]
MARSVNAKMLSNIWKAFHQLNPKNVKAESEAPIRLAVVGVENAVKDAAQFLVGIDPKVYEMASDTLLLLTTPLTQQAKDMLPKCDIVLRSFDFGEDLSRVDPRRIFTFSDQEDLRKIITDILRLPDLEYAHLPLARALPAFRPEVCKNIIQTISLENAIFVVSTSLGNIIPNPLAPLAALAASAGDLVVLTANQIRMLFMLAAAHSRDIGFKQQSAEIASILGAAFGWRSIARELVGQIPLGGGIIPKAAIAFAGTWAAGEGIVYYYTTGRHMTKEELRQQFDLALEKGKTSVESITAKVKETFVKPNLPFV